MNYEKALTFYLDAEDAMNRGLEKVRNMVNFVNNGAYLLAFSLIGLFYIRLLREITISRDEFIKRLYDYKQRAFSIGKIKRK